MPCSLPNLLGAVLVAGALGVGAPGPVGALAADASMRLALSTLGDLSSYRTIAADTLVLVDKGDIPAARARIKDLETAWDKAEPGLKPKDKAAWSALDGMIDAALADLRMPAPKAATCAASLKGLIAKIDAVGKA